MRAWIFQDHRQVQTHGKNRASYFVGWVDPDGKRRSRSCGSGSAGHAKAKKLAVKRDHELATETYDDCGKRLWRDFIATYRERYSKRKRQGTRENAENAIKHFERIVKPEYMRTVTTDAIADYVATRSEETKGKKTGRLVSPATINKELRHLREVLRKAHSWGYLKTVPMFVFEETEEAEPTYITPEHFAKLYAACDRAVHPGNLLCPAGDWWRALLYICQMTGWRIGAVLALRWEDVKLDGDSPTMLSRAAHTKGRRSFRVPLDPDVVDHLRGLQHYVKVEKMRQPSFLPDPRVFPWANNRRTLWTTFQKLQKAAGVAPEGESGKKHYGFHDLRRAFATMNVDRLSAQELQAMMQHRSFTTTQGYIAMGQKLRPAVAKLYKPDLALATSG